MPRRDDIEDIPMLKPDSDEIKAFRGVASQPTASTSKQGGSATGQREATIHPTPLAVKAAVEPVSAPKHRFGLWLSWLLVIAMLAFGGWWMHNRIVDMEDMLTVSRGELGHARKRIGELEALVVATDVNANKSGTVVQAQVKLLDDRVKERSKFVDSEIDKLWGVAYRTNKPAIVENKKAVENNSVGIQQHTEQLAAQTSLVEKQQELIASQQTSVANIVAGNKQMTAKISQQDKGLTAAQGALQTQKAELAEVLSTLVSMRADNGSLQTSVGEAQQSLIEIRATSEVLQAGLASLNALAELTSEATQKNGDINQRNTEDLAVLRTQMSKQEEQLLSSAMSDVAQINMVIDQLQSELAILQRRVRVVGAMEQTAAELDERLYMTEQSLDSIVTFRQETNRKLDQLANQIRNLQYQE
ncbi:MAG: hypothetical protein QGG88_03510 [Gammaproteobacteria bacterium]|jgi:chromosome segregation ATPase|nr:hypothetical protein [Gammaproteobacteria bacterium]